MHGARSSDPPPRHRIGWRRKLHGRARRRIRVQRAVVVPFPDRDDERTGVIRTIFMKETLIHRPTSGATADDLAAQLCDVRTRTRRLTEDLSTEQLMGPMLPIVNPVLWEIGHVGWFHEYWTLRHAHGEAPMLDRADVLWNSSTVAHATRWDLDLPDRDGVFGYMTDVLGRQLDRLGGGVDDPARYFYELSIRHEDMHVEALAYTRQTLGYARPEGLGRPATDDAGAWPGDVEVPGGRWRLGSTAADGFVFDNEKWAHEVGIAPFRIAKAPVTNAEFAAFVDAGGYRNRRILERCGLGVARARGGRTAGLLAREATAAAGPGAATARSSNSPHMRRWRSSIGTRLKPGAAGPGAASRPRPNGRPPRLANRSRTAPVWPIASAAGRGARRHRDPELANLDFAFDGPLDVAACAAGDSAFGCRQMIGNVWEWTASDFVPFRGLRRGPIRRLLAALVQYAQGAARG